MKLIKNIAGTVYFIVGLLFFVATMLVVFVPVWLISLMKEPMRSKALHPVFKAWMGFFMPLVGCPVIRKGKENFKEGENYVVIINHNSLVDIPVSSPWIPGANKTLAKIEMSRIPLFGVIYKTGSVLVDRKSENSRRESFTKMQETLNMGLHLCLYPEGTRNKSKEPIQKFHDGAFITAIKAQKPIMPGVVFNTGAILPHNKTAWARPKAVHFHFLPAVPTAGLTMEDLGTLKAKVHALMTEYYVANKQRLS